MSKGHTFTYQRQRKNNMTITSEAEVIEEGVDIAGLILVVIISFLIIWIFMSLTCSVVLGCLIKYKHAAEKLEKVNQPDKLTEMDEMKGESNQNEVSTLDNTAADDLDDIENKILINKTNLK